MQQLRLFIQNLIHRTAKQGSQLGKLGNIRHTYTPLPIGNCLKAHVHLVSKLCLRHIPFFPHCNDPFPHLFHIKHHFPSPFVFYFEKKLFLKKIISCQGSLHYKGVIEYHIYQNSSQFKRSLNHTVRLTVKSAVLLFPHFLP